MGSFVSQLQVVVMIWRNEFHFWGWPPCPLKFRKSTVWIPNQWEWIDPSGCLLDLEKPWSPENGVVDLEGPWRPRNRLTLSMDSEKALSGPRISPIFLPTWQFLYIHLSSIMPYHFCIYLRLDQFQGLLVIGKFIFIFHPFCLLPFQALS